MTGGKNALGSLFGQGPGHHGDEYEQGAIAVAEEVAESGGEGAGGEGVSFVGVRGRRSLSVQMRAVGA